jgi:hypothetical protein
VATSDFMWLPVRLRRTLIRVVIVGRNSAIANGEGEGFVLEPAVTACVPLWPRTVHEVLLRQELELTCEAMPK